MIVTIQCNDCLRKFPAQWHYIYYCPWCQLFNCEVVNIDIKLHEAIQQLIEIKLQFPNMLTPNYATPETVKKVLVECEDFN